MSYQQNILELFFGA